MSGLTTKTLDKFCKVFLSDIPIEHLALTDYEKKRLQVVREAYQFYMGNKLVSSQRLRTHIQNLWNRKDHEVDNDIAVLQFIVSRYDKSSKDMIRNRSVAAVERAIEIAADKGNEDALIKGGLALYKVGECDVPDPTDDEANGRRALETVITDDFTKTEIGQKGGHTHYDEEAVLRLQKQFGGNGDVKELILNHQGIFEEEKEEA